MKYCSNCGNEVLPDVDVCLSCGKIISKANINESETNTGRTLGIISLFVWIIPIASWIVGTIGLMKSKNSNDKILNVIGIVLATIMFVLNLVLLFS